MYRYFIFLRYKGKHYHGWQLQANAETVQEALNKSLSILLQTEISTLGCGRTDTGVHAHSFVAHFDFQYLISDTTVFLKKINSILSLDISCFDLKMVSLEANARFDAISRTYKYFIVQRKDPFLLDFSHYYHFELDIAQMNTAAKILLTTKDFTSFAKLHTDTKTNDCLVTKADWSENYENNTLIFTISANRFLRNMVRSIVGTLLDVGRNKLSVSEFQKIINGKSRSLSSSSAPAKGLFLWQVDYPSNIYLS
ncbi:MAG: tRNA pseudouridine(38-40) synthase TruA [Bacteroidales bacterium]